MCGCIEHGELSRGSEGWRSIDEDLQQRGSLFLFDSADSRMQLLHHPDSAHSLTHHNTTHLRIKNMNPVIRFDFGAPTSGRGDGGLKVLLPRSFGGLVSQGTDRIQNY